MTFSIRIPFVLPLATIALLSGAAVAQPAPSPAQPQRLTARVTLRAGGTMRVHELVLSDQSCGHIEDHAGTYEDTVKLCVRPAGASVLVEVEWRTRNGASEYKITSSTVTARKAGKFDIGQNGGPRFTFELI